MCWHLWSQHINDRWAGYPLVTATEGTWHIWLVGELYDLLEQGLSPEQQIRAIATGRTPATELNGHALLLAWHGETRTWHVWTDRFGTLHGYYATDGSRAALGTFSPAVAAAASTRQLDWEGLIGFCAWGFFPQDRTHYTDMRILRPASHYIFDERGHLLQQERYWQWRYTPDTRRSYSDTLDELDAVLRVILDEQLSGGRVALPISGGLDSRTTVALAPRSTTDNLWAYAYGYGADSVETRIAQQIAEVRALPFQRFTVRPYLFANLGTVLACLEGFQDVTQARQASVADDLAAHAEYVIAAHWGDVWFDAMGLVSDGGLDTAALLEHARHKFEKRGRHWLLSNLCAGKLDGQAPDALLGEILRCELDALSHIDDPDFRIKALKTEQWSFRWTTASLRMYQAGVFPRLPFYDTRITDFFCTVPSAWLRGRQLQIDYLKRFAPDLARITWQTYDANLYRYQYFNTWQLPKRALKKAWRTLTRRQPVVRNWELQFLSAEGRHGLAHWLLRPGLCLHDLVPPRTVHTLVEDFYAEPLVEGRGYTISLLLTLSAWLEQYGR
jgi:hypothetical protein